MLEVKKSAKDTKVGKEATAEKNASVAEAVAPVSVEEQGVVGTKSETVQFVAPLGNPARDDTTLKKDDQGVAFKNVTPYICGYKFKALEDMMIPDCGTTPKFAKDMMDYDPTKVANTRKVKKGETFDLTPFETALLLSPKEFNGVASGGGVSVVCCYSIKAPVAKDGSLVKTSNVTRIPRVVLKIQGKGSIKDFKFENVLTVEKEAIGDKGKTRRHKTIVAGYEKWAPLCTEAVRKPRESQKSTATRRNKNAEAFLSILNSVSK